MAAPGAPPTTAAAAPTPPEAEQRLGMRRYLTPQRGIGGRLRTEPEDFVVIELGSGPRADERGTFTAARVRLKNWETNRFAGIAARRIGIKPSHVGFAGMKDKRAVTEQWFSFKASPERVDRIRGLEDVEILATRSTMERQYAGAHAGNRFVLRVRDSDAHEGDGRVEAMASMVCDQGGVPSFFGPQRFGAAFRPITHRVGAAIVAGDLEEAVRLYLGEPLPTEREEARAARQVYEDTRDPAATLEVLPDRLDPERRMLERLVKRPGDWRHALRALPGNLLQLFVHAHQSWIYNHVLSARLEEDWPLDSVQVGDRVMALEEDGTRTHLVTHWNLPRVRREVDKRRAAATAPLMGHATPLAEGEPGALEARVLSDLSIDPDRFRCPQLPDVASAGRRRPVLQAVHDLEVSWVEGDPVFAFSLGKGDYATTVLREFMKADIGAY